MEKQIIEVRRYAYFLSAIDDLKKLNAAGYHADLTCLDKEPSGFGINIGDYYELTIFRWTAKE